MPKVDGFAYCAVCIDYQSKYSHAKPLATKSASEVAGFLFDWICMFGCPEIVINDQGKEFVNEVSNELYLLTGTRQRVTRAYNPQANGQCERQNKIIKIGLLKTLMAEENIHRWPEALNGVMLAHRTQKQRSTNYSPYYMLFGREPLLPLDLAIEGNANTNESKLEDDSCIDEPCEMTVEEIMRSGPDQEDADRYAEELKCFVRKYEDLKSEVLSKARKNIKSSQRKMKTEFDKRHGGGTLFQVGNLVLKRNLRRDDRKGDWQQFPWSGPYRIISISDGAYKLQNIKTKVDLKQSAAARNLKIFVSRNTTNTKDNFLNDSTDVSDVDSPNQASDSDTKGK